MYSRRIPFHNEHFCSCWSHRAPCRPAIIRIPATAIRLLDGRVVSAGAGGQRCQNGLKPPWIAFRWHDLEEALADVIR